MKDSMRFVIAAVLVSGLFIDFPGAFAQQGYPGRPIRVIHPLPAGGVIDLFLRGLSQAFAERNGQNFLIESRPGANSIIAAETCAKATADGYAICILAKTTVSLNPSLYAKLSYDPVKSFEPITQLVVSQEVLVVSPSLPVSTFRELVDYSRQHPGKINYASSGVGSNVHLTLERVKHQTGANFTHIPYKGAADTTQAFLSGDVHIMYLIIGNPGVVAQVQSGQSRALLVSGEARSPLLPGVPTFAEAGFANMDAPNWFGMFAPAGTPKEIIGKLSSELSAILRTPAFRDKFLTPRGFEGVGGTPDEFARFLVEDRKRGAELVRISGARLD